MVRMMALWLPILLSAVIVFVVSSIIHMLLPYHRNDYKKLPSEDDVAEALRKYNIPPGDYMLPRADSMESLRKPEFVAKMTRGPVALMTVMKNGPTNIGASLVKWFVYSLVVGVFVAYVCGRALHPGAQYRTVFRFAGCTAFLAYALALWQDTIWYHRSASTTVKYTIDGFLYALMTAGTFGWLWPR